MSGPHSLNVCAIEKQRDREDKHTKQAFVCVHKGKRCNKPLTLCRAPYKNHTICFVGGIIGIKDREADMSFCS